MQLVRNRGTATELARSADPRSSSRRPAVESWCRPRSATSCSSEDRRKRERCDRTPCRGRARLSVAGLHTVPGQRDDHANAEDLSMRVLARRAPSVGKRGPPRARLPTAKADGDDPLRRGTRDARDLRRARARDLSPPLCRGTSSANFADICVAACSLTGSLAAIATRALGICSWPSRARAAASAPAALEGAWPTRPPTWSTACCRTYPCASSFCRCRTSCACSQRSRSEEHTSEL